MATKSNPEKEMAVSGASPRKARHTMPAARPKHSASAAETPVSVENSETGAVLAASGSTVHKGPEPTRDQIARLAYLYWLDRGGPYGSAEEDWFRAEQELRHGSTHMQ